MKQLQTYALASFLCCLIGFLLYAYMQGWFVIYLPTHNTAPSTTEELVKKKRVTLFFWYDNQWHSEPGYILWHDHNPAQTLLHLITCWMNAAPYSQTTAGLVHIQNVAASPQTATAYLSFDASPFTTMQTIAEKAFLLEGLLATISEQKLPFNKLQFLVHHKPLEDMHLDFSNPWPINGFFPRPH